MSDLIQNYVSAVITEQNARVESDLAEAMTLQDFDKLERLCVVHVADLAGSPPTVASMLEGRWERCTPDLLRRSPRICADGERRIVGERPDGTCDYHEHWVDG
jgi:hypothetical protein